MKTLAHLNQRQSTPLTLPYSYRRHTLEASTVMKYPSKTTPKTLGLILLSSMGFLLSVMAFFGLAIFIGDSLWYVAAQRAGGLAHDMLYPSLLAIPILLLIFGIVSLVRRSWYWASMSIILPVVMLAVFLVGFPVSRTLFF